MSDSLNTQKLKKRQAQKSSPLLSSRIPRLSRRKRRPSPLYPRGAQSLKRSRSRAEAEEIEKDPDRLKNQKKEKLGKRAAPPAPKRPKSSLNGKAVQGERGDPSG